MHSWKRRISHVLLTLGFTSTVASAIPAAERDALLSLYNSTNGPGWTNKTNWNGPVGTECTWFGVTCLGGSVTFLQIPANQLSGTLPPLDALTNLQVLTLSQNKLVGPIPSLSGLHSLQYLQLGFNQLSGEIPPLTGLTDLVSINLPVNQLSGSIPSLAGLTYLQTLILYSNQLTGSIPPLSGLTVLQTLNLSGNRLTGPIPSFAGLPMLQFANFNANLLSGSIPPLTDLPNLQYLGAVSNHLTGSIPSLAGLSNLQSLWFFDNQLTGTIPPLDGLANLADLRLGENHLTGSIPSLAGLINLQTIDLASNQLTGPIPPLDGLAKLQYVQFGDNELSGPIPSFEGLTGLQNIYIFNNRLSGPIPTLTGQKNLQALLLDGNQLTGSIPSLAGLVNLQYLSLSNNQLTGTIPPLTDQPNLQSIFLGKNQLTGPIPTAPPHLEAKQSTLCPNFLTPSTDAAWDAATGATPWSKACSGRPAPPSIDTVTDLYSAASTIQSGSWFSISGANLAVYTDQWSLNLPTSLGQTSVTVNGKAAYLGYASPNFLNVEAPDDTTLGPVEVKVITPSGSATSTATLAKAAPSFNLLDDKHIAAIIVRNDGSGVYGNYDIVGPTGDSLGYKTVAAKAGDILELYGVGFGPTDPTVPAGSRFVGAAKAVLPIQLVINGKTITPDWAGMSGPGLFQLNVVLPSGLGSGDQEIQATVNGVSTPTGVVLALQ